MSPFSTACEFCGHVGCSNGCTESPARRSIARLQELLASTESLSNQRSEEIMQLRLTVSECREENNELKRKVYLAETSANDLEDAMFKIAEEAAELLKQNKRLIEENESEKGLANKYHENWQGARLSLKQYDDEFDKLQAECAAYSELIRQHNLAVEAGHGCNGLADIGHTLSTKYLKYVELLELIQDQVVPDRDFTRRLLALKKELGR